MMPLACSTGARLKVHVKKRFGTLLPHVNIAEEFFDFLGKVACFKNPFDLIGCPESAFKFGGSFRIVLTEVADSLLKSVLLDERFKDRKLMFEIQELLAMLVSRGVSCYHKPLISLLLLVFLEKAFDMQGSSRV